MQINNTTHVLAIVELSESYNGQAMPKNSQEIKTYESSQSFGEFHVGETFADAQSMVVIGRIQHIHHMFGTCGNEDHIRHETLLYIYPDNE